MSSEKFDIMTFLEDENAVYFNPNAICFESYKKDRIRVLAPFPGTPESDAGALCRFHRSFTNTSAFQKTFNIQSQFELDMLTPEYLARNYKQNNFQVWCRLPEKLTRVIAFAPREQTFLVFTEGYPKKLCLEQLTTVDEFMKAATGYFYQIQQEQPSNTFSVYEYLKAQEHLTLEVSNAVSVQLREDQAIILNCPFPDYGIACRKVSCQIKGCYDTEEEFVALFQIKCEKDLCELTEAKMYHKFKDGKAGIVCSLDLISYSACLMFKYSDGLLMAEDEWYAKEFPVPGNPTTAAEFIEFTLRYAISSADWKMDRSQ